MCIGNNTPWHVKTKLCVVSLRWKQGMAWMTGKGMMWHKVRHLWGGEGGKRERRGIRVRGKREWWYSVDEGRRVVSCYTSFPVWKSQRQFLLSKLVWSNNLRMKSNLYMLYVHHPELTSLPEWKTDRDRDKNILIIKKERDWVQFCCVD